MNQHITQSEQWAKFRLTTPNVKKVLRIGGNQIYLHRLPYLPNAVAYLPRPQKLENLEEIKKACQKERALFLKIDPSPQTPQIPHTPQSKPILPRHTIYLDLTKSENQLLSEMHEKTRYNIRLAEKKGVMVKEGENLEEFIKLLEKTEGRQGFYSHYPNYYRQLWSILRPAKMVYLLCAYLPTPPNPPNPPIAAIMLFNYDGVLYYPYGGSDPKFREYQAPSLLHWEAMKLGKKLGCKTYDLWGSYKDKPVESDPWWGIYRFKSGFGGQEVDFPPSFDVPLSPLYPFYSLIDSLRWKILKLRR